MCRSFFLNIILLCLLGAAVAPGTAFCRDVFAEGDRLGAEGLVDEAITSYLRILYQQRGTAEESELCARIARCYAELGDIIRAVRYCNQAVLTASGDVERRERLFLRVEILLAGQRYRAAEQDLEALAVLSPAPAESTRRWFLEGVLSLYRRDWERAFSSLSLYFVETDTYPEETEIRVLHLLSFARRMWNPDPDTARVFSFIVPGLGQMYAGDVPPGLNSLLVTGGAGLLVVLTAAGGDWPDAIVLTYFVFLRFYLGSPFHAERVSREKAVNRSDAVLRGVLRMLTEKRIGFSDRFPLL